MAEVERLASSENLIKQSVLDAAIAIMSRDGYDATTLERACELGGVEFNVATRHFADRDALIIAVMKEISEGWISEIQSQVNMVGSPLERRDQLVMGLKHIVLNRPELLRVMYVMVLAHDVVPKAAQSMIERVNSESLQAIADGFNDALGVELPDMDLVANTVIGVMLYTYRRLVLNPELDTDRIFDDLKVTIDSLVRERFYRLRKMAH